MLVWQAEAARMHPALSQELMDDAYEDDAEAAAAGVGRVVPQRPRVLRVDGCH